MHQLFKKAHGHTIYIPYQNNNKAIVPKIWGQLWIRLATCIFHHYFILYKISLSITYSITVLFFTISTEVILGLPISPFVPYNLNQITISPVHQALSFVHDQTISNDSSSPYITIYVQEKE